MRQALSAVILGLILARPVSALECISIPLATSMASAEIVLLGRIDAARFVTPPDNGPSYQLVTVTVKDLWKATTRRVIELHQPLIAGGISFGTETGKDYVLFVRTTPLEPPPPNVASLPTPRFTAAECVSRPAAAFDLKQLGASRPPLP